MTNDQVRYRPNAPRAGGEIIEGEAILIDFVTGAYYSLVDAGGVVWAGISRGLTRGAIVGEVQGRYEGEPEQVRRGVIDLCEQLLREGLITVDEAPAPPSPPPAAADSGDRPPFVAPQLAKYTDMEQLLLLDPVHEVDDAGWPVVPTE